MTKVLQYFLGDYFCFILYVTYYLKDNFWPSFILKIKIELSEIIVRWGDANLIFNITDHENPK